MFDNIRNTSYGFGLTSFRYYDGEVEYLFTFSNDRWVGWQCVIPRGGYDYFIDSAYTVI